MHVVVQNRCALLGGMHWKRPLCPIIASLRKNAIKNEADIPFQEKMD
jgi:hypothetical protein